MTIKDKFAVFREKNMDAKTTEVIEENFFSHMYPILIGKQKVEGKHLNFMIRTRISNQNHAIQCIVVLKYIESIQANIFIAWQTDADEIYDNNRYEAVFDFDKLVPVSNLKHNRKFKLSDFKGVSEQGKKALEAYQEYLEDDTGVELSETDMEAISKAEEKRKRKEAKRLKHLN